MKKILLVEKDQRLSTILKMMLEKLGHAVTYVKNGKEAFSFLKKLRFDLVLTNLAVEFVTGPELLQFVKKQTNTPVAVMSAITNQQVIGEYLSAGADAYINTPLNPVDFVKQVNTLLK